MSLGDAAALGQDAAVTIAAVGELAMFGYLGWALWRVRKLKQRRARLEQGMAEAERSGAGHTLPVAV